MITGVINNVLEDYGSAEESIEPLVHILGEFLTSKRLEYLATSCTCREVSISKAYQN
jgi:hypothetical protein